MTLNWLDALFDNPLPPSEPPPIPVCACGVHMYAPDSQAAGLCFLCRKRTTNATGLA
jgi:hypothetical protein